MEEPGYIHPDLRPALQETHGVIVYHEQVIRALAAIAGYDLTYADHIRRHLDREELLPGFRADFLAAGDRARRRPGRRREGVGRGGGVRELRVLQGARGGVRGADVPVGVAEGALSGALPRRDPHARPRACIRDGCCWRTPGTHGIPILPLDANRSEPEYVAEETAETASFGIRLALQDVHGISDAEIRSIMQARAERPFRDVGDFLRRTTVSRPVAEALAHAGAFDRAARDGRRTAARTCTTAMTADARARGGPAHARRRRRRPPTGSPTTPTPRSCGRSWRCSAWTPPGTS